MSDPNSSMTPAILYVEPDTPRFQDDYRRWQGIPSIEVTEKGRIFVNFFSGQGAEVGISVHCFGQFVDVFLCFCFL